MNVAIINTGCANILSVQAALDRLAVEHWLAESPADAKAATRIILPGVGSARPAMERLRAGGWVEALRGETRPLLGICLGMQLLFESSEEDNAACLGVLPGRVVALPASGLVLPHMGWNTLQCYQTNSDLLEGIGEDAYAYFVHSYCAPVSSHTIAQCYYGSDFSAAVQRNNFFGCQFHPERSANVGARILSNFIKV